MPKGKSKGTGYEREACKNFSKWWSDGERDDIFWRPLSSGGRATVRLKKGLSTPKSFGDMFALDSVGDPLLDLFVIEIKRGYNDLSFLDIVDSTKKLFVLEWVRKAEKDRAGAKVPYYMFVFKRDRRQPCIMLQGSFFSILEDYLGFFAKESSLNIHISLDGNIESFVIVKQEDFFEWCSPNIIKFMNDKNKRNSNKKI